MCLQRGSFFLLIEYSNCKSMGIEMGCSCVRFYAQIIWKSLWWTQSIKRQFSGSPSLTLEIENISICMQIPKLQPFVRFACVTSRCCQVIRTKLVFRSIRVECITLLITAPIKVSFFRVFFLLRLFIEYYTKPFFTRKWQSISLSESTNCRNF